jgi:hypothetical protein
MRGYGGVLQPTLAFLPGHWGHQPALMAAFGMPSEPEPGELAIAGADLKAVHLTKLKPDGSGKVDIKPNKIAVGHHLGAPIVLAPPNDLLGLTICEGVEDALSTHEATGIGAWASGGATFLPALADAVPEYTDTITIFGDDDVTGRRCALQLAVRLLERGFHKDSVTVKFLRQKPAA